MINVVQLPAILSFSRQPVTVVLATTMAANTPNGIVLLRIEVWTNGAWKALKPLMCPPDANGMATFRIAELLHAYTSPFFPTAAGAVSRDLPKYRLSWAESYGIPPATTNYTTDIERFVVRGGLRTEDWNNASLLASFLSIRPGKFLSTAPNFKTVSADSLEYLYLILQPESVFLRLNAIVLTKAGAQVDYPNIAQITAGTAPRLARFEAGYDRLPALTTPADEVYSYTLYVTDQSGLRSRDVRTYRISDEKREARQLLYENSLGGIDTVWMSGNFKDLSATEQADARMILDYDYTISANGLINGGEFTTVRSFSSLSAQVGTGYKTKAELVALRDALSSQHRWEFYNAHTRAITFVTRQIELRERDKHAYSAVLEYKYCYAYTAMPPDDGSIENLTPAPPLPVTVGDYDARDYSQEDYYTV
jgi:hypothetical protein